jgi:hypothetical protein
MGDEAGDIVNSTGEMRNVTGLLFVPQVIYINGEHGGKISTEENC